jgi:putative transposase
MKNAHFSDSQIIAILKQAESVSPVPELCREHGMSSAAWFHPGQQSPFQLPPEIAAGVFQTL